MSSTDELDCLLVSTTFGSVDQARAVARQLVQQRLAACGQVTGPLQSMYWWGGVVEAAREWLLLLKTTRARYPQLEETLRRVHPYEVPQIVAVPIERGGEAYLQWVRAETHMPAAEEDDES